MIDRLKRTIMLASSNKGKAKEYEAILAPLGYRVITMDTLGVSMDGAKETSSTFEGNSLIKAVYAYKLIRGAYPVLADDSGISFDGLDGFPGVHSARWNVHGDSSYKTKNAEILKMLKDNPNRACEFTCVITFIDDKGQHQFKGELKGVCAQSPRQVGDNGFGYDPIFEVSSGKTLAEMTLAEKDAISHRGQACQKLIAYLKAK